MKTLLRLFLALGALLLAAPLSAAPAGTVTSLNAAGRLEANASARYERFAEKATAEGHAAAARLFRAVAKAKAIHRNTLKAALRGIDSSPESFELEAIQVGATKDNLAAALRSETTAVDTTYPALVASAKADGIKSALGALGFAGDTGQKHLKLFRRMAGKFEKNPTTKFYVCPKCGNIYQSWPSWFCSECGTNKKHFLRFD